MNGRTYRLACGDGEETRLQSLAAHVKAKVDTLAQQFGQVGEDRLFLMAALLVADELFELRDRPAGPVDDVASSTSPATQSGPKIPGKPPQATAAARK